MCAESRTLQYALLGSLLLHALMLFSVPALNERWHARSAPAPIVARLVEPAPAAPPAPVPAPLPAQAPPEIKPQPQAKPQPEPEPRPREKLQPKAQAPATPRPRVASPAPVRPRARIEAAPPPLAAPSLPPAPAPAVPSQPGASSLAKAAPQLAPPAPSAADLLRAYRERIHDEAARYKRYPRAALDNGWHGRVLVRMVVGRDGMIASLTVADTSGHAILDRQAMDMMRKAKGAVPIPPAWRGRQFTVELPVIYNLNEQTEEAR